MEVVKIVVSKIFPSQREREAPVTHQSAKDRMGASETRGKIHGEQSGTLRTGGVAEIVCEGVGGE